MTHKHVKGEGSVAGLELMKLLVVLLGLSHGMEVNSG